MELDDVCDDGVVEGVVWGFWDWCGGGFGGEGLWEDGGLGKEEDGDGGGVWGGDEVGLVDVVGKDCGGGE